MAVHGYCSRLGIVTWEWFILAACWLVVLVRTRRSRFTERLCRKIGIHLHTQAQAYVPPQTRYTCSFLSSNVQTLIPALNLHVIWSKALTFLPVLTSSGMRKKSPQTELILGIHMWGEATALLSAVYLGCPYVQCLQKVCLIALCPRYTKHTGFTQAIFEFLPSS